MSWFLPFDSFDHVVLLQLKMWGRENQTVTVIFDPTSITAEFEVSICRNYGETVGVNRSVIHSLLSVVFFFFYLAVVSYSLVVNFFF